MPLLHRQRVIFGASWIVGITAILSVWNLPTFAQGTNRGPKCPWMDKNLSPDRRAELVLQQMTLDEKVTLVHGIVPSRQLHSLGGAGFAPGIPRLGIPDVQSTDGRSGVGATPARGRYATALPSALALAASWDLALAR